MPTMLGSRRRTPLEALSVRDLIVQIRWERAKRAALDPDSPARIEVDEREALLRLELHRRFGAHNITARDLEWLIALSERSDSAIGAAEGATN